MRYFAAIIVVLLYMLFCYFCWFRYRQRQTPSLDIPAAHVGGSRSILVAFASQTGTAERIALQSARQLQQANIKVQLLALNQLTPQILSDYEQALFVVSTYGEGEPPDNGGSFLRRYAKSSKHSKSLDLRRLQFGVLALGDRSYQHFCGFGHNLEQLFHSHGAQSLFDLIEVDQCDESDLRHWQYYLGQLTGETQFTDWAKPEYQPWLLQERSCLNPCSSAAQAFHLRLTPTVDTIDASMWQAGDIAEIGPCNSPALVQQFVEDLLLEGDLLIDSNQCRLRELLQRRQLPGEQSAREALRGLKAQEIVASLPELPHREYSIASLPDDGALDLVVRQMHREDGRLGIGSGWLTEYAQPGNEVALRIRSNPSFHAPVDDIPLILIGNGTGLAGLRAHMHTRIQQERRSNWLIFGERSLEKDFFFGDEILQWKREGWLSVLDLAFSRDQKERRYVQHLLLEKSADIKEWIQRGAAIYVCGSLQGMAKGVDDALSEILGREQLETLGDVGRYCRDVY